MPTGKDGRDHTMDHERCCDDVPAEKSETPEEVLEKAKARCRAEVRLAEQALCQHGQQAGIPQLRDLRAAIDRAIEVAGLVGRLNERRLGMGEEHYCLDCDKEADRLLARLREVSK